MVKAARPFTLWANMSSRGRLRRSASSPPNCDSSSMGNDWKKGEQPQREG